MAGSNPEKLIRTLSIISFLYPDMIGLMVRAYFLPPDVRPLPWSDIVGFLPMLALASVVWNIPFMALQAGLKSALTRKTAWIEPLLWAYAGGIAAGAWLFSRGTWDNTYVLVEATILAPVLLWLWPTGGMLAGLLVGWFLVLVKRFREKRMAQVGKEMAGRQGFEPR